MCLKQENILGTQISQEQYDIIIQQLIIWVFEIENIKALVQIEEKTFFDVINLFFISPAADIVNKYTEKIKIRCPPSLNDREIDLISI